MSTELEPLSAADIEAAMKAIWNAPARPTEYAASPDSKAHLDEHGGGRADCDRCLGIWMRMESGMIG